MSLLASIDSTGFRFMMLLHILAVVIGFAPAWLTPFLLRLANNGDKNAAASLESSVLRLSLPGIGLAGVFGFGLAGMSDKTYKMSQAWLSIAVALWLILLVLIVVVERPAIKAYASGNTAARGKVMAIAGVTHLILVAMLYLMIFKPGL
ncbi:MAG: hypothetical protein ABIQ39_17090 [Ilumatobacteraceae bacterium]